MTSYYIPHFFKLEEFMPPAVLAAHGPHCWEFMDYRIPAIMDRIRNRYGKPITINNWHIGGLFTYRGFRPPDCTVGAPLSQHRFGRAVDFDVQGMTADEVRADIRKFAQHIDFNPIMAMETGVTWVHLDVRAVVDPIRWFPK